MLASDRNIHSPEEIYNIIRMLPQETIKHQRKNIYNFPCAFDIETTSFFNEKGEKVGLMYCWQLGLNGHIIFGRTFEEFMKVCGVLTDKLRLGEFTNLIIYVHNLAYEFQFIYKYFDWVKVFSLDNRKPVNAVTSTGLNFKCSYILSGYSLEVLGKNLKKYKCSKLHTLNYDTIRHSETPMTYKEKMYCVNDVKVVMAYIQEKMEEDGNITKILLTKTGYVRQYCRNHCFYENGEKVRNSKKKRKYQQFIKSLSLEPEEYKALSRAFQGGFTHSNYMYNDEVVEGVTSKDETSAYPSALISELYPMAKGEYIQINTFEEFNENLELYCCLFEIQFEDLEPIEFYENYIPLHKCYDTEKVIVNNGRVRSAKKLSITITEQDYFIIEKFYKWKGKGESVTVRDFWRYKKAYLPTDFVKSILYFYNAKTTLKGVEGKEVEYLSGKEMLNSTYGMAVTSLYRPDYVFTDKWEDPQPRKLEDVLEKENKSPQRFLFYPWGVWCTAYARKNLFMAIYEIGHSSEGVDYIYCDTDSVKYINSEKYEQFFEEYNKNCIYKLEQSMKYHNLPLEMIRPKTVEGDEKPLGIYEFDGTYTRYKTLGSKRYMVEKTDKKGNKHIEITVSGLNKKICSKYIEQQNEPFNFFSNNMLVPEDYTGKLTHTYIDDEREGFLTDYTGKTIEYCSKSSIHLSKQDYNMKLSQTYTDFLKGVLYGFI